MTGPSGALGDPTCAGQLLIDTTAMCTVAWIVGDLWQLWGATIDYRGAERQLPYVNGTLLYPKRTIATRYSLPMRRSKCSTCAHGRSSGKSW